MVCRLATAVLKLTEPDKGNGYLILFYDTGGWKQCENWERFRDDWENNRIVVHVDPFKAMDAWKNGVTHTLAPMVWFFGLLCIPASLILAFFFFWWVIPLGLIAFLACHFISQHLHAKAMTRAMLEDEAFFLQSDRNGWVKIVRVL